MGFGALLSPLIADPFLSEASCLPANSTANITSGSHLFHASRVLGQHQVEARPRSNQTLPGLSPQDGAGTHVSYAFWIMALINVSATGAGLGKGLVDSRTYQSIPAPSAGSDSEKWAETEAFPLEGKRMGELTPRDSSEHKEGCKRSSLWSFGCDIL